MDVEQATQLTARGWFPTPAFYEHAGVRIHHGDALDILPTMPSGSVDFILTDPPYLVDYKGRWDGDRKGIVGDRDPRWVYPAYEQMHRLLKDDSLLFTFYGWPHADIFVGTFKALGFRIVSHVVFIKNVWGLGQFTRGQHETGYLLAKGKPAPPTRGISDIFEWERERDAVHPNQKPLCVVRKILTTYAPECAVVLDPFMGSGTTLRAALDLGMRATGIEVEERWCRHAAARLAQGVLFT